MKTKFTFAINSFIIFLGLYLSQVILFLSIGDPSYMFLSLFILFTGIVITLICLIIGSFLNEKNISKNLLLIVSAFSVIFILISFIYTLNWEHNEEIYFNEIEKQYLGLNKEELLLKFNEPNECFNGGQLYLTYGTYGRKGVDKNMTYEMRQADIWIWDCQNTKKYEWLNYKFLFDNNMEITKVIIQRRYDSM